MKRVYTNFFKHFSTKSSLNKKICIVGAGPAGFYAAQHLVKTIKTVEIDIYERLPVPFGLVRFGVAPDHPEVKNVINTFTKIAENPQVQFIGNVALGSDIFLKQLREAYDVVLLTYGAEENRRLNIPGEDIRNVLPARKIVGWYNGVPEDANLKIDLSGSCAVIFGQGNVAIDVARILLSPINLLKNTDITQHALESLSSSKIEEVYLIGRRGPLQAAFTIKELREMLKLENCKTFWNSSDFSGVSNIVTQLARPKKRITELMLKCVTESDLPGNPSSAKRFKPMFFKSPLQILGEKKVKEVIVGVNKLEGDDLLNKSAVLTDIREKICADLVVTSIGYRSVQADSDLPFDIERGVVKNKLGKIENGLYTTGWLATGPSGVILNTMNNAFSTADLICRDLVHLKSNINKPGYEFISKELQKKNIQVVKWKDWLKIDAYEQQEGKKLGKPREKILDIKKMLELAS